MDIYNIPIFAAQPGPGAVAVTPEQALFFSVFVY